MNTTAVIYKSRYGSTRRYASYIAQELGADLYSWEQIDAGQLLEYEKLVFGGGLYAGKMAGIGKIKKYLPQLWGKKMAAFTVGLTPCSDAGYYRQVDSHNFNSEMRAAIRVFHYSGNLEYDQLVFSHRLLIGLLRRGLQKKGSDDHTSADEGLLSALDRHEDCVDVDQTVELLTYMQE